MGAKKTARNVNPAESASVHDVEAVRIGNLQLGSEVQGCQVGHFLLEQETLIFALHPYEADFKLVLGPTARTGLKSTPDDA